MAKALTKILARMMTLLVILILAGLWVLLSAAPVRGLI